MKNKFFVFLLSAIFAIVLDRALKDLILAGFRVNTDIMDITFVLNNGVAFSMLAFLGPYLKYTQIVLLIVVLLYALKAKWFDNYALSLGFVLASGASNVYDRFAYGGVIDYMYWHYYFNFAIFNAADVLIDIGVAYAIYINYKLDKAAKCA